MRNQVYIAGPFFNPEQQDTIQKIELMLQRASVPYVSPRLLGNFESRASMENRRRHARDIFDKNVEGICLSRFMIAVIDDRDPGTMWEMGMFYALAMQRHSERRLWTTSAYDYLPNIMIEQSIDGHYSLNSLHTLANDIPAMVTVEGRQL